MLTHSRTRAHTHTRTRSAGRALGRARPPRSAARGAQAPPRPRLRAPRATPPTPRPAKAIGPRAGAAPRSLPAARRRCRATREGAPRTEAPGPRRPGAGSGRRREAPGDGGERAAGARLLTGGAGALRGVATGATLGRLAGTVGGGGRAAAAAPQNAGSAGTASLRVQPGRAPSCDPHFGCSLWPRARTPSPRPRRAPRRPVPAPSLLFWGRPASAALSPRPGKLAPQAQPGPAPVTSRPAGATARSPRRGGAGGPGGRRRGPCGEPSCQDLAAPGARGPGQGNPRIVPGN